MAVAPRYPRPSARAKPRTSNARHTLLAIMGVVAVFALAFLIMSPKSPFSSPFNPFRLSQPASTDGDAELYTGTIQLPPARGNLCRRMTFDNRTGELHDKGSAPCEQLAAAGEGGQPVRYWRNNIEQVRQGFRNR